MTPPDSSPDDSRDDADSQLVVARTGRRSQRPPMPPTQLGLFQTGGDWNALVWESITSFVGVGVSPKIVVNFPGATNIQMQNNYYNISNESAGVVARETAREVVRQLKLELNNLSRDIRNSNKELARNIHIGSTPASARSGSGHLRGAMPDLSQQHTSSGVFHPGGDLTASVTSFAGVGVSPNIVINLPGATTTNNNIQTQNNINGSNDFTGVVAREVVRQLKPELNNLSRDIRNSNKELARNIHIHGSTHACARSGSGHLRGAMP